MISGSMSHITPQPEKSRYPYCTRFTKLGVIDMGILGTEDAIGDLGMNVPHGVLACTMSYAG